MEVSDKVAFFDFCETLVDFQTAGAFVDFVREEINDRRVNFRNLCFVYLRKLRIISLIDQKTHWKYSLNKRLKLYQLKGLDIKLLEHLAERYYIEKIRVKFIPDVLNKLKELQVDGFSVGLVSGGYGIYLKYFVEEFGLQFCYSSNIGFSKGRCTGRMVGLDCMRENKIVIVSEKYSVPPAESQFYTDSKSDLPLLNWVKDGIVVSKGKHQKWIDNYNFKEIIWD